jgi:hypothetical protein
MRRQAPAAALAVGRRERRQYAGLGALDRGLDRGRQARAGARHRQALDPPVGRIGRARDQRLADQPLDHVAQGRAVVGDQGRQGRRLDPGMVLDRDQRGILHRRDVEAGGRRLLDEQRDRDLLAAPDQMARLGVELVGRHPLPPGAGA